MHFCRSFPPRSCFQRFATPQKRLTRNHGRWFTPPRPGDRGNYITQHPGRVLCIFLSIAHRPGEQHRNHASRPKIAGRGDILRGKSGDSGTPYLFQLRRTIILVLSCLDYRSQRMLRCRTCFMPAISAIVSVHRRHHPRSPSPPPLPPLPLRRTLQTLLTAPAGNLARPVAARAGGCFSRFSR